jgi:prepilin-type N-terminal cleavage/methylation domain-containing protein
MRDPWMLLLGRRLRSDDHGFTLVELLTAMMVLSIVMVVFGTVFASVLGSVTREDNLSQTNDQARLALEQLDREIRSGNVLYDPANETADPGYILRVYTQSNATTRTPNPGFFCTLWKIDTSKRLLWRTWPPLQPEDASNWRVIATGVVNKSLSTPAFSLDSDPNRGSRTIVVTLKVNQDLTNRPTQTQTYSESITGRNTSFGYPFNVCEDTPSG